MSQRNHNSIILMLVFIILVLIFTFPLAFKRHNYIPGFQSTDEPYGALWNFWWLKYILHSHLSETRCSLIAAPFGIDSTESGYPLWNFINKWLSIATSNVFAYNFETLFSFFASAVFMYYLALYLCKDKICSIFSAIIYSFCPYHFARAWQHLGLAQIQWMPFYILALLKLKEKTDLKHIALTVLSLFFVFSFDFYYAYFMLIVTSLFVILLLGVNLKKKFKNLSYLKKDAKLIGALFVSLFLVFLLITPSIYQTFKNRKNYAAKEASAHNPFVRPFEDLFSQSARPLSYFLPSTVHPVFGQLTEGFIGSDLYGESLTEHTLYLGWVALVLAFIAFKRWRLKRKQFTGSIDNFSVSFFISLAIASWLFSQPPWWNLLGFKLYMPSFFMYKILPMFRAYCRFGIVVMLAVSVLAGFGLKFTLENFNNKKKKIGMVSLLFGLVIFEFWNYPPFKVIDVQSFPEVYYWIKEHPQDFVIAEYPLDADSPNEMYKFYQTKHEKKIINGTIPGTHANMVAKTITKLSAPHTAGILKWMGVKYVLVHRENYLKTDLVEEKEELGKIPANPGIKLVRSFLNQSCPKKDIMCIQETGPIDVYEVIALSPIEPKIKY